MHSLVHDEMSPEKRRQVILKGDEKILEKCEEKILEKCEEKILEKCEEKIARKSAVLTLASLPARLCKMEYAVRGEIDIRAESLRRDLKQKPGCFPNFCEVVPANIGNPQAVGQLPITFYRQVLAGLLDPSSLDTRNLPSDVCDRVKKYLSAVPSMGAYSHSRGLQIFRNEIAEWFRNRDGFACDPDSIFLSDGASGAIRTILELVVASPADGVLIPVPQYPLYSASITRFGGVSVPYYLNEAFGWRITREELERAVAAPNVNVKALVVINPGNPTSSVLAPEDVEMVIRFCEEHKLVLLADEVYQANVYHGTRFVSFRHVLRSLGSPVELFSFHSASKGLAGECGLRGGLVQLENVEPETARVLYTLASVSLCANTIGQAALTCSLVPPQAGEPSFELYARETGRIFEALQTKALMAEKALNGMRGVSCQRIVGSMYAFPRLALPSRCVEAAREAGVEPDMLYCRELLMATGIVCVPGSGFKQQPGTNHFRITILPDNFAEVLRKLQEFHEAFLAKYE